MGARVETIAGVAIDLSQISGVDTGGTGCWRTLGKSGQCRVALSGVNDKGLRAERSI